MKKYIVIFPDNLISSVLEESIKIQKEVYTQDGTGIFFRVQTKSELDDPQRLFLKGDGRVIQAQVRPHLSLVHNIDLPESETDEFMTKIEEIAKRYKPFYLEFDGIGNYGKGFTFFLRFKNSQLMSEIREEMLEISKKYLTPEELKQHTESEFVPHLTLLYDDIDPEKVARAQQLLSVQKFKDPILVNNIQIWEVTGAEQKLIKLIKLS